MSNKLKRRQIVATNISSVNFPAFGEQLQTISSFLLMTLVYKSLLSQNILFPNSSNISCRRKPALERGAGKRLQIVNSQNKKKCLRCNTLYQDEDNSLIACSFHGHTNGQSPCNGTIAECNEDLEILMESAISRRFLEERKKYISPGALKRDQPVLTLMGWPGGNCLEHWGLLSSSKLTRCKQFLRASDWVKPELTMVHLWETPCRGPVHPRN
uniref:Uncharacterized protein n=1 Tax=Nicotiana tabacum TaxID=4097 RepID=A0A1S4CGJ0_TOBAC|nr:PREDICTED: uncharacterized protein LOC107818713 [Nicotiana tabacum]